MRCVLLTLLCVFAAACVGREGGFRVRFGATNIGTEYFVELPQSVSAATNQGWTQAPRANQVLPTLSLYCHGSYHICVLFDDTDYVAGLQIAFVQDDLLNSPYDWTSLGFSSWTPGDGNTYWTTQQYFVNEEFLATSAASRIAARDTSKLLQADGRVWTTGLNGDLVVLDNNSTGIVSNGFTEQSCIPYMGVHYYRNMTTTMSCEDDLFPWFALTDIQSGELIATGLVIAGSYEQKDGDWFERPASAEVQMIVPRGPQCLYDLADTPGVITLHIYYIDAPWTIAC